MRVTEADESNSFGNVLFGCHLMRQRLARIALKELSPPPLNSALSLRARMGSLAGFQLCLLRGGFTIKCDHFDRDGDNNYRTALDGYDPPGARLRQLCDTRGRG
jgi:hypothetical protein